MMEYLEGESLAQRLAKGPLPLQQVLRYGVEIAEALDRAHRQGVTHRDLKPGNVMLTKAGAKLLDFGLAKLKPAALERESGSEPTASPDLTGSGMILGTLQYMAPEQVEGKAVDHRADIFAFGAILYEMATGKKAFEGGSQASLIGAILRDDPQPISALQPLSPSALDALVSTCLAKDPDDRWQSAGDLGRQLRLMQGSGHHAASLPSAAASPRSAWQLNQARALGALAALAAAAARHSRAAASARSAATVAPRNTSRHRHARHRRTHSFALSPDGRQIVFVASGEGGSQLWLRSLATATAQPLSGHRGSGSPFWSPDGRSIGFFADGALKRLNLGGGAPQTLAPAFNGSGGTWNADGVIVFAPSLTSPLMRVSAAGGETTPVTLLEAGANGPCPSVFLARWNPVPVLHARRAGRDWDLPRRARRERRRPSSRRPTAEALYLPAGWLLWVRGGRASGPAFEPRAGRRSRVSR